MADSSKQNVPEEIWCDRLEIRAGDRLVLIDQACPIEGLDPVLVVQGFHLSRNPGPLKQGRFEVAVTSEIDLDKPCRKDLDYLLGYYCLKHNEIEATPEEAAAAGFGAS